MATAKANKKASGIAVNLPECPVCLDVMTAPIFQCQSGHSLCNTCTTNLMPPLCPICRLAMTQMRNWQLEEIVFKAKVPCPNKSSGCVYTMVGIDLEDHLKECIFREMECPLGAVFGRCSWRGKLKDMMNHFKERHAEHCDVNSDADVVLKEVSITSDDRHFFLTALGKVLFIITVKIDTLQKMAYWCVQQIGSKKGALQYVYEIHITSNQDPRRKAVFIDHCFNDAIKADEVFRTGKCAVLPLDMLANFIKNKQVNFRFFIKKIQMAAPKNTNNGGDDDVNQSQGPKGPKGPNPKGPGPKTPGPKPPGPGPKQKGVPKGHPNAAGKTVKYNNNKVQA